MTSGELDAHYAKYQENHDHAHILFEACVRAAMGMVKSSEPDRPDIAHAAAWSACEKLGTIKPGITFFTWFVRIVKNKQRDFWRKANSRTRHEEQGMFPAMPAFTLVEQHDMREAAGEHRELIDLLLAGHRLDEAADVLGVSVRTVKQRLNRLKKAVDENV